MISPNNTLKLCIIRFHQLFVNAGLSQDRLVLDLSLRIAKDCALWTSEEGAHGLARFKNLSSVIIRHAMGIRISNPDYKIARRYSRIIRFINDGDRLMRLYWVSILSCHRLMTLPVDFSVTTIISRFSGSAFGFKGLKRDLRKTCQILQGVFLIKPIHPSFKWVTSGSGGPNGSPAFKKSREDLVALYDGGMHRTILTMFLAMAFTNAKEYQHHFTDLAKHKTASTEEKRLYHSRLGFIQDKGGKTRVIGIVDLMTQSLLKPVHDHVTSILRIIPTDGTYDQNKQRVRVQNWARQGLFMASLDLTACTDRFPASFQMWVLIFTRVLTLRQGLAWLSLIKSRTFSYLYKGHLKGVRYEVGQPMGAYSSWPVMALSHHALVQLAYFRAHGRAQFYDTYALLGDDIVIADPLAAESYKTLIRVLGIDYSPSKSFECYGSAEFAKSLFCGEEVLTPFPLSLMKMKTNTIVTNTLALLEELAIRKIRLTDIAALTSPFKWTRARKVMRLAVLSPKSNKTVFPTFFTGQEHCDATFSNLLLSKRLDSFLHYQTWNQSVNYLMMWRTKMEWKFSRERGRLGGYVDPLGVLYQIGSDNSDNYPIRDLDFDEARSKYQILVGYGWLCYNPEAWPSGISHLSFDVLDPGQAWETDTDDMILRSTLLKLDKLFPGYFEPKCVKHTYKVTA